MHRQPFCWCVLWRILFYPSFNSSRASSALPPTVGCHLGVREKRGKTQTWLSPPFTSAQCSWSLLKHLTASPSSRSLAGGLLGRSQRESDGRRAGWVVLSSMRSAQALARLSAEGIHSAQRALEIGGDNNATIHYFKTNTIWSVDLSGSVKLVPLKEQLAREEHVTSPRARDSTWG